ncbi:MAG: hypothetical protein LBP53_00325 [Candidatus Peribacteria bacterium]|nr:hypothetical protein [Candidatus Peribacteria bacterium]
METSETMEALIELTNSASLSYEDLLHLKRLTEDQLGRNYSLLEYERDHHKNSNQKVIDILEYIDENFNYQRTDRDYDELYHSLD